MRAISLILLVACGSAPAALAPTTKATLAGERCKGESCTCRAKDSADSEAVPEGKRRYEVRMEAAPGLAWLVIDTNQLHSGEATPACFYLDLAPGEHTVRFRGAASADPGVVGATMSIAEHNPKGPWWYDVFSFACGNPGACTVETMKQWKQEVTADRKSLTDPCSGTRIAGLNYTFGHMPGNDAAREVEVTFQLHVKPASLDMAPRSEECPEK